MLAIACLFFGTIIAVNMVMAFAATGTFPGLVVENSYVASQHYDELLAKARAQDKAGWQPQLTADGGSSASCSPTPRASGSPRLASPRMSAARRRRGKTASSTSTPVADGAYAARETLPPGLWEVDLEASRGGEVVFRQTQEIFVKPRRRRNELLRRIGGRRRDRHPPRGYDRRPRRPDLRARSRAGPLRTSISSCRTCIAPAASAAIERALGKQPGVAAARANLTSRRVGVDFDAEAASPDALLEAIEALGYSARPFDAAALAAADSDEAGKALLRSIAVAGFAAGNIMLLSVSVWSGADDATRDLFHWISALIALPAIVYAGQPFFRSAWRALKGRSLNMDVPISLAVILAAGMSLYETATHGAHAWFDASVGLLFFLLVGRYLDHRMRGVARSAAARLLALSARSAMRVEPDGTAIHVPVGEIAPGDRVRVAAGERVPVDATILEGASDVDRSMLTGETDPEPVAVGARVFAGTLNLTGPLLVQVTAKPDRLPACRHRAPDGGGGAERQPLRASSPTAPRASTRRRCIILSAATFVGWLLAGAGWHQALTAAIAVLIITCPCALGLAVPAVQVVASGLLMRRGIMLKDGAALERLAAIDTVVFDKTGHADRGPSGAGREPARRHPCLGRRRRARQCEPPSAGPQPRQRRGRPRHYARDAAECRGAGRFRHGGHLERKHGAARAARMGRRFQPTTTERHAAPKSGCGSARRRQSPSASTTRSARTPRRP